MPENGAQERALSGRDEAEAVARVFGFKLDEGKVWCVIDGKWFRQWCAFSGFSTSCADEAEAMEKIAKANPRGERPGRMDNSGLLAPESKVELRKGLTEVEDFALVNREVYDLLIGWYDGGPLIERAVVRLGVMGEARVELYPVYVRLVYLDAKGEPDDATTELVPFSATLTLNSVLQYAEKKLNLAPIDESPLVRLWRAPPPGAAPAPQEAQQQQPPPPQQPQQQPAAAVAAAPGGPEAGAAAASSSGASASAGGAADGGAALSGWNVVRGKALDEPLEALLAQPVQTFWVDQRELAKPWRRSNAKKNFRDYQVGDVVDACDTMNKWYESEVVQVDAERKKVFIHFINWNRKWDEWLPFDSDRIDMQGSHTNGPYVKTQQQPQRAAHSSYSYYGDSSFDSSQKGKPLARGVVGLRNLGNTCFMNSTLQCLANAPVLTNFFVSQQYLKEINRENPLGWKGRIAEEYGKMIREIWSEEYAVVAPTGLKRAIGEFAPRFSGYQQQDSSELLSFLLDGLHEDLNQVRNKPATRTVESNGRPDSEVAAESWQMYQMRNRSKIVDTLMGQLKSRVECPKCDRVSVTFDPFLFLQAPLPQTQEKVQRVTFVWADPNKPLTNIDARVPKVALMNELRRAVAGVAGVSERRLVVVDVGRGSEISRILDDEYAMRDIYRTDKIYVFELPELDNLTTHQVHLVSVTHTYMDRGYRDLFCYPHLLAFSKKEPVTRAMLRERADALARRFVKAGFEAPAYRVYFTNMGVRYCAFCAFEKNCMGCETVDDKPIDMERVRPQIVFDWLNRAEGFNNDKLKIVPHESIKASAAAAPTTGAASTGAYDDPDYSEGPSLDLGDCLEAFTREEVLGEQDAWYCSKCKDHMRAKKKMEVWRMPDVLIIHLKRFSHTRWGREKLNTLVNFPLEGLNMSKYCPNPEEKDAVFDLFAVSNHMGGLGGGHYTAYVKSLSTKEWYVLDDSSAHPMDRQRVISPSAYVLYYERRKKKSQA